MWKLYRKINVCLATVISASMLFSAAAMAAPIDELNAVLEKQHEQKGESLYSGTVFQSSYDAATGDLDADLIFNDEYSGEIVVHLDSVIASVENGFVWTIDALELQAEGQSAGICAEIGVSSDPGEITTPENPRMIFSLDESGLIGLLTEISANVENWAAMFVPEAEAVYDVDAEYEDGSVKEEAADESAAISIIGGADGPTSIFIAGKVG